MLLVIVVRTYLNEPCNCSSFLLQFFGLFRAYYRSSMIVNVAVYLSARNTRCSTVYLFAFRSPVISLITLRPTGKSRKPADWEHGWRASNTLGRFASPAGVLSLFARFRGNTAESQRNGTAVAEESDAPRGKVWLCLPGES